MFFRADGLTAATDYLKVMFGAGNGGIDFVLETKFLYLLIAAAFFSFYGAFTPIEKWQVNYLEKPKEGWRLIGATLVMGVLLLTATAELIATGFNPFIYFRF
ncbi:MAG: hypothetical protein M0D57_14580 [Sphingobacteriales bacterium JAD_PAG50586_3]|nr:MAG: hypothetical protein M0D57_14580 [Sphingobacteriales bacterium JAD_PAG50586_3]